MQPAIFQTNMIVAPQPVASSVVTVIMGSAGSGNTPFSYLLPIGKRIYWELDGMFTLGATGGFRFLADNAGAETFYNARFKIEETAGPTAYDAIQVAQAAFANASAVATTYSISAKGSVIQGATAGVFSLKFAQDTPDVLPITLLPGLTFKLWIQ